MAELSKEKMQKLFETDFNVVETLQNSVSKRFDTETKKIIPPEFNVTDTFTLEKGTYFNKETIKTTVGRYLFNKVVIRDKILSVTGYFNQVITDKVYKSQIDATVTNALQEDKIDIDDFSYYLMRLENFTNCLINTQAFSFTKNVMVPNEKVMKRKKELLAKHKNALEAGDVDVAVAIEKELVDYALKELKGDPGLTNYLSGARGSFESNYKEMNIIKGPVYNAREAKWEVVANSLDEGIDKKDLSSFGNAVSTGAYPKALGTAVSGHFSKQIVSSLETIVLDKKDRDSFCGTKKTLEIVIPESIKTEFVGKVIKEGSKVIELTYENIDKYINKKVNMYSIMFCLRTPEGYICDRCGDRRLKKLGITNIGMAATRLSSTMLNMKTKQWHNATVKLTHLNKDDLFF